LQGDKRRLCHFSGKRPSILFGNEILFLTPVLGGFACQSAAAGKGTELPILHLLTKTTNFFLKQPDMAPLSGVTGRRSQTENGRQTFSMK